MLHIEDVLQLKEDEEVRLIVRRHAGTLLPPLLLAFVLIVTPFFMLFRLFSMGAVGIVIFAAAVLLGIMVALHAFIIWDADVLIVTTQRVVDVDQRGVFNRFVTEALYPAVQDIAWNKKGMLDTLMGVGTLRIQTLGASTIIEAKKISHPEEVQELVNDLRSKYAPTSRKTGPDRGKLLKDVIVMLEGYSPDELVRIQAVLKARERGAAADAFFAGDDKEEA